MQEILNKLKNNIAKRKQQEESKKRNEYIPPNQKNNKKLKKIKKITKFKIESGKPHCLLYRIRKINPEINLNYQLELYQKKQRYSVTKNEEMIDENKYTPRHFMRANPEDEYTYHPCLSQRLTNNNFYMQNKKSIGHGIFRSIHSNFKGNKSNKNYNYYDFSSIFEDKEKELLLDENNSSTFFITNNRKVSTKYTTKANSAETSRPFSPNYTPNGIKKRNNILTREKLLYLKLRGIELKNRIHDTLDKANNASIELNQDIYNSRNYDKIFGLNDDEKYFKKNYKKINENKNKLKKYLFKCVDVKKNESNLFPRFFQYLDKEGKQIFIEARELDKYKQKFLNLSTNKKNFVLNSKFYVNNLISELNELGSDILATKKKYKGEDAIEPKNEKQFFHGLIKENLLRNLSDENYIDEVIRRKNVAESLDNKVEKRLFALKQKSLAKRHKVRQGNYV